MARHQRRDTLRAAVRAHLPLIPMQLFTAEDMCNWLLSPELHPEGSPVHNFTPRSGHSRSVAVILAELARQARPPIVKVGVVSGPRRLEGRGRQSCYARCLYH